MNSLHKIKANIICSNYIYPVIYFPNTKMEYYIYDYENPRSFPTDRVLTYKNNDDDQS